MKANSYFSILSVNHRQSARAAEKNRYDSEMRIADWKADVADQLASKSGDAELPDNSVPEIELIFSKAQNFTSESLRDKVVSRIEKIALSSGATSE